MDKSFNRIHVLHTSIKDLSFTNSFRNNPKENSLFLHLELFLNVFNQWQNHFDNMLSNDYMNDTFKTMFLTRYSLHTLMNVIIPCQVEKKLMTYQEAEILKQCFNNLPSYVKSDAKARCKF